MHGTALDFLPEESRGADEPRAHATGHILKAREARTHQIALYTSCWRFMDESPSNASDVAVTMMCEPFGSSSEERTSRKSSGEIAARILSSHAPAGEAHSALCGRRGARAGPPMNADATARVQRMETAFIVRVTCVSACDLPLELDLETVGN